MRHQIKKSVILRNFSSSDNRNKWVLFHDIPHITVTCVRGEFLFYANGNCEENKGYVSIIYSDILWDTQLPFRHSQSYHSDPSEEGSEIRYFFSVIDISGNKRFTQSIVQIIDKPETRFSKEVKRENFDFGLERYLKRETLLNDPAELLPGDCLTILVEIDYVLFSSTHKFSKDYFNKILEKFEITNLNSKKKLSLFLDSKIEFSSFIEEGDSLCIPLDTFYGRKLCVFSGFFRRASETLLTEDKTREVNIPHEELAAFSYLLYILFKPTMDLDVESIEDICQVYIIADKYDFQTVINDCRQLIKAVLRTTDNSAVREHAAQSVPVITELAEEFRDIDLKNAVNIYLETKENFGSNNFAFGEALKERIFSDWKCIPAGVKRQLRFSRIPKSKLEFYK